MAGRRATSSIDCGLRAAAGDARAIDGRVVSGPAPGEGTDAARRRSGLGPVVPAAQPAVGLAARARSLLPHQPGAVRQPRRQPFRGRVGVARAVGERRTVPVGAGGRHQRLENGRCPGPGQPFHRPDAGAGVLDLAGHASRDHGRDGQRQRRRPAALSSLSVPASTTPCAAASRAASNGSRPSP